MNRIDIWKALSDKEAGNLKKLHLKREAFNFEKIRIENKVLDIESYIYEYKSGLQDYSEMNSGMQRIHQKMNMISQLSDVRSKLMRNKLECIENIKIINNNITLHEIEMMKFDKMEEKKRKIYKDSELKIEVKNLDELAIRNFQSALE
jgi:flagellar biosynthesis chaperone FliJ